MSTVTKKLINSPDTCVDECLYGLVAAHPQLHLHARHRVVTDGVPNARKKVAVISGGGAGHEPFAAGYVGPGMLTAAISGSVFASPPSSNVMHAIRHAANTTGDVFLVIPNYTGDILNFGLSVEIAKGEGINIDSIVIGEDIALEAFGVETRAGRRGMCGMVVTFKVLGHLSWKGESLGTIKSVATTLSRSMASIGLGVSACSLPGAGPLFHLADDEMELGVGVHGEAGVQRLHVQTAAQVVHTFLTHVAESLSLRAGDEVAAVVNNLGAMSNIEQWVVTGELHKQLAAKQVGVARLYAGPVFTSLNMAGVQVCLLKLSPDSRDVILEALDAPTAAPAWPGSTLSVPVPGRRWLVEDPSKEVAMALKGATQTAAQSETTRRCLEQAARAIAASEVRLNELDSGCGDGDCGTTLRHLAQSVLSAPLVWDRPATLAVQLADIAQHTMGGTSGALYSLLFTAAGHELEAATDFGDARCWAGVWAAGVRGMMKYSLARIGDRTMFDSLKPACDAFSKAVQEGKAGATAMAAAEEAAKRGCAATSTMKALAGRASYVEGSQLKEVDAGAFAVTVWVKALYEALQRH